MITSVFLDHTYMLSQCVLVHVMPNHDLIIWSVLQVAFKAIFLSSHQHLTPLAMTQIRLDRYSFPKTSASYEFSWDSSPCLLHLWDASSQVRISAAAHFRKAYISSKVMGCARVLKFQTWPWDPYSDLLSSTTSFLSPHTSLVPISCHFHNCFATQKMISTHMFQKGCEQRWVCMQPH